MAASQHVSPCLEPGECPSAWGFCVMTGMRVGGAGENVSFQQRVFDQEFRTHRSHNVLYTANYMSSMEDLQNTIENFRI